MNDGCDDLTCGDDSLSGWNIPLVGVRAVTVDEAEACAGEGGSRCDDMERCNGNDSAFLWSFVMADEDAMVAD
ncbi:hypothetical protein SESBI_42796 [Sesbania bispinosa]|nr:hypothetical protein SESBI_42796 [Sesbania bispinosa]